VIYGNLGGQEEGVCNTVLEASQLKKKQFLNFKMALQ
jgi:hypothetical protein